MEKGAVNAVADWSGGLQEPNGLKCPRGFAQRRATTDATVNRSERMFRKVKTTIEPSVWNENPTSWSGSLREPGCMYTTSGCVRIGHAPSATRFWKGSEQPGAESSTYRIKGSSFEHVNLNPSAGSAKPGKPPSPVMSWMRGGTPGVVRARENRAHGDRG
jgi:hypothetical protein